jgi:hypothetical protein
MHGSQNMKKNTLFRNLSFYPVVPKKINSSDMLHNTVTLEANILRNVCSGLPVDKSYTFQIPYLSNLMYIINAFAYARYLFLS